MAGREEIRDYVATLLSQKGEDTDFDDTDSLVTTGKLDSLDVMQMVTFLEQNFAFDFSDRSFSPDDFDSVENIVELLEQPQAT